MGEAAALQCALPESAILVRPQLVLGYPGLQTTERGEGSSYHYQGLQEAERVRESDESFEVLGTQSVRETRRRRVQRCGLPHVLCRLHGRYE